MVQGQDVRVCQPRLRVGLTLCASVAVFFLFGSVEEVERGLVGTLLAFVTASAIQLGWSHSRQIWFWCVASAMMLAAAVQVLAIEWPHLDTLRALGIEYLAAAINALVWLGLFRLAPLLARELPQDAPVRCRVCGLPTETGSVRCGHCGEWKPASIRPWPVAITVAPVVLVVLVLIAI